MSSLRPEWAEANRLSRNNGHNRFVDITVEVGVQDLSWSGDASAFDVNENGWLDLYILNMQGRNQYYETVSGQRFVNKTQEVFPKTSWRAMGIKVFDFSTDGCLDLFVD